MADQDPITERIEKLEAEIAELKAEQIKTRRIVELEIGIREEMFPMFQPGVDQIRVDAGFTP